MQKAHPVEAVELEQEEPWRGRRGVLEASSGEVGGVEPERRRDGAELKQPVLEEVPRHGHGPPPPRQHPEDDVAPPPVRAHVPLDDAEAEEEDDPAEVAAEARLVGAADGDDGGVPGGVGEADLHHLVAGQPHPVLSLRSPAAGRGGGDLQRGCRGCGDRQRRRMRRRRRNERDVDRISGDGFLTPSKDPFLFFIFWQWRRVEKETNKFPRLQEKVICVWTSQQVIRQAKIGWTVRFSFVFLLLCATKQSHFAQCDFPDPVCLPVHFF